MSQSATAAEPSADKPAGHRDQPKYPGIRVTCNGNQLVTQHVETRITEGGVFYPITPSTEGGEIYQQSYAQGELNVWGQQKVAVETEGEHAAQGGATAFAVTGRRTVNFTSGQGIVYAMEQYYHAPGKLSTMVLEIGARALTKHALNVHCGHDDFYAALDTGWIMLMSQRRAASGRPGDHPAQGLRAGAESGHEHPGRHAHDPLRTDVSGAARPSCCASSSARPTT